MFLGVCVGWSFFLCAFSSLVLRNTTVQYELLSHCFLFLVVILLYEYTIDRVLRLVLYKCNTYQRTLRVFGVLIEPGVSVGDFHFTQRAIVLCIYEGDEHVDIEMR